jgi:hypothetical protein
MLNIGVNFEHLSNHFVGDSSFGDVVSRDDAMVNHNDTGSEPYGQIEVV